MCRAEFDHPSSHYPVAMHLQRMAEGRLHGFPPPSAPPNDAPLPSAPALHLLHSRVELGSPFFLEPSATHACVMQWIQSLWLLPATFDAGAVVVGPMQQKWMPFVFYVLRTRTHYSGTVEIAVHKGEQKSLKRVQHGDSFVKIHRHWRLACQQQGTPEEALLAYLTHQDVTMSQMLPIHVSSEVEVQDIDSIIRSLRNLSDSDSQDEAMSRLKSPYIMVESARMAHCETELLSQKVHLVWLPVYSGSYIHQGAEYPIVIDGINGQVQGHRPYGAGLLGKAANAVVSWVSNAASSVGHYLFGYGSNGDGGGSSGDATN